MSAAKCLASTLAYALTRGSRPEVVMIPYDDFLRWQELQEKEVLARFDRLVTRMAEKSAAYGEEEVAADIERVGLLGLGTRAT